MNVASDKLKGLVLCVTTVVIWGVTFVNTKALLESFNSFEILFIRYVIAYLALWAIAPRRFRVGGWREELAIAAMGLSGVAAYQYLENRAIEITNASNVAILVSTCPMGAALLSALFFRERSLSVRFLVGFLLAIAGVAMVCVGGVKAFRFRPLGDLLAFGAMGCWSVYSVLITRANRHAYDPRLVTRRAFFWALVAMAPFLFTSFDFGVSVNAARFASVSNLFHLGFLGLLASALAFVMWGRACQSLGTVRATCGIYAIPVVTAVVAHLALGESLTAVTGLGATLVILGVVVSAGRR